MTGKSIFAEEWRECLRAQYVETLRNDDQVTLKSLVTVMHEVGFNDDDLRALYLQATIRADDVPDGFVPDSARAPRAAVVVPDLPPSESGGSPGEADEPDSFVEDEIPQLDMSTQDDEPLAEPEFEQPEGELDDAASPVPSPGPQQLSLF